MIVHLSSGRSVWFAAVTLLLVSFAPRAVAQANSTNIAGTNNVLQASASSSAIIAASASTNGGTNSAIIGAANSVIPTTTRFAFIGAGSYSTVAAGAHAAGMVAGFSNALATGSVRGAVVGGAFNTNAGRSAAILAGEFNQIGVNSTGAAVVGGLSNLVSTNALYGFIGGGRFNEVRAPGGAVIGGFANEAAGTNSFAAGSQAVASNTGTFVWADMSTNTDFISTGSNQFLVRAIGGVGINTNNAGGNALLVNGDLRVTGQLLTGSNNTVANGVSAVVGGGLGNSAIESYATVGGGRDNTASGSRATVAGGNNNTASGSRSAIGGGSINSAIGEYGTIGGGASNTASGIRSTVAGGWANTNEGVSAFIGGGELNTISDGNTIPPLSSNSVIGGGLRNVINNHFATIGGGRNNTNTGNSGTIGGGYENRVGADSGVVGGGKRNLIGYGADHSAVLGGYGNNIEDFRRFGTIGGGSNNRIGGFSTAEGQVVAGGALNTNLHRYGVIGGGYNNSLYFGDSNDFSVIAGGLFNKIGNEAGAIGGGEENTVAGRWAVIPGGYFCRAYGELSFAAGYRAYATNTGSFVWNGGQQTTSSTNDYSFTVRAPGGARFLTTTATNAFVGVILTNGATDWASLSDSNSKTDFAPVKSREILAKVAAMPLSSWHYKHNLKRRYIGPMAQDFHATFGLGADDKTISTLDSDGVMYAAIQGLVEELKERDKAIEELKMEMRALREQVQSTLPPVP